MDEEVYMDTLQVNIHEAKIQLPELIEVHKLPTWGFNEFQSI